MKVERTSKSSFEQSFRVTVPASDVEQALSAHLEQLAGQTKLAGFRPGKVPAAVIRQRFGADAERTVVAGFVQRCVGETLRERKLSALDVRLDGEPPARAEGEDLQIEFSVDVAPKIKLARLERIEVEAPEAEVTDADVEEGIETLSLLCGTTERADDDHAAREQDILDVDLLDRTDGEERELAVAASYDPPGFRRVWGKGAEIAGLRRGDDRTLDVETAPDADLGPFAGRKLRLGVRVRDVQRRTPATREEIVQRLGIKGEDELEPTVRAQAERESEQAAGIVLWHRALEALVDAHSFRPPEAFLERKVDQILAQSGSEVDAADPELRESVRKSGERRLCLTLLLEAVIEENGIDASFQETAQEVAKLVPRDAKDPQAEFNRLLSDPDAFTDIRRRILDGKAFGFVLDQVKRSPVPVSREELQRLVRETPQPPVVPRPPEGDGGASPAAAQAGSQGEADARP